MTDDNNAQWLHRTLSGLDDSIVWNFPETERKRLANPFLTGTGTLYKLMENDLDEKLALFRGAHPEMQGSAEIWEPFLEYLDGQALGGQATAALNLMTQGSSYETTVYRANLCIYLGVARLEIGDASTSPVRAIWRTRLTEAIDRPV